MAHLKIGDEQSSGKSPAQGEAQNSVEWPFLRYISFQVRESLAYALCRVQVEILEVLIICREEWLDFCISLARNVESSSGPEPGAIGHGSDASTNSKVS